MRRRDGGAGVGRIGRGRLARGATALLVAGALAACEGLLDVDDRSVILPEELEEAGPSAIPTLVNGMVASYHEAADNLVLLTSLLTDEMISASTFPDRLQVDRRFVPANNLEVSEFYTLLHRARFQADTLVLRFEERLDDPDFADAVDALEEGIVLGKLYGGYARLWLAELFCWSILDGIAHETVPVLPDARMVEALLLLQEVEEDADAIGLEDVRLAAIVGQARARLWLGEYAAADALAREVPRDFLYWSEYSANHSSQYNEVYSLTWGDPDLIHWTVGDGSRADRGFEMWEHIGAFVDLSLIRYMPPGFTAQAGSTLPIALQTIYGAPSRNILMASGVEAYLIRAEAEVRATETGDAETLLNDLRSDHAFRATVLWGVDPPAVELGPLALSGDLETDVKQVADERARELWLTGDRMATARRLRLDGTVEIDLFPPVKVGIGGGDDIAFPIPQDEIDRNPNVGAACPAPQAPGSWM